ncbi:MAG TPA: hypothetical protein VGP72_06710 [Planctomycetota bacterium]|jgi:hypothetical protein
MSGETRFTGPIHLHRYLTECTDAIADIVRNSVDHPISSMSSLRCQCVESGVIRSARSEPGAKSSIEERTALVRKQNIESSRAKVVAPSSVPDASTEDRRLDCRFFSLKINDEQGVVHAFCRRCERRILVYDRDLYWGVKRQTGLTPPTFPYKCSCGSHTFEVVLGWTYPEDALDENDLDMLTVAVRCATCNEIAIIFNDEAT